MEYLICDVSAEMIEQVHEIETLCFSMPWTEDNLKSQLKDDRHEFIAAVADGKVLGYVGMMYVLDEGYISNVAVRPEYRRQGIGAGLIGELLTLCRSKELSFVTLEVRKSNFPAMELYRKHGFEIVGTRKNYYELPKEDAILMTKYLKEAH